MKFAFNTFSGKFTNIVADWPGCIHDSHIQNIRVVFIYWSNSQGFSRWPTSRRQWLCLSSISYDSIHQSCRKTPTKA